jgi:hypothetical protein
LEEGRGGMDTGTQAARSINGTIELLPILVGTVILGYESRGTLSLLSPTPPFIKVAENRFLSTYRHKSEGQENLNNCILRSFISAHHQTERAAKPRRPEGAMFILKLTNDKRC